MRIWPVILDSQPDYLSGRGRSGSLLLLPLGAHALIEHLRAWLDPITGSQAPLVVSQGSSDADYTRWISAVCPSVRVATTAREIADAVEGCELSDALLIIDPRSLPLRPLELSTLVQHFFAEPRVSHHLVAFESAVAGTKERVSFDAAGQIRTILRHYEPATWPFIAGVTATLLPVSSGLLADGVIPNSLVELRQMLAARGVPSRDWPVQGGALDLNEESGLLAANEHFVRKATGTRTARSAATPVYLGNGHSIHSTARISGPVVIHPDAHVGENAMVFGPAVIGAGARVSSGAVVAHAAVGPDCTVPSGRIVRNRVWFEDVNEPTRVERQPVAYSDRLGRLMADALSHDEDAAGEREHAVTSESVPLKRMLDVAVAAAGLILLAPVLLVVAAAVWLESKGSILYGDKREGVGGRVFRCWKFRTMYAGAHAAQMNLKALDKMDGPHFKLDRDPRVTRVGRLLRTLNLDELPQLINVLVGEMSLVGPRPSPFRENQVCVPWREARLSVRPGITGFWQVCRHDRSAGDFHQWIEYDLLYVQHLTFWLDLKILAATLLTLGGKAGHVPSSWLVSSASVERDAVEPAPPAARRTARAEQVVSSN